MEQEHTAPPSLYEKISGFAKTSTPPVSSRAPSRVKPARRYELIIAAALIAVPIALILLIRMFAGISFIGDIMVFGLIGVALVGIVYALSAAGAMYYSKRSVSSKEKWIAAAVLDHETRYDDGIPAKNVILELEDGRRVTLQADETTIAVASPGKIGWASIRKTTLAKFAAG